LRFAAVFVPISVLFVALTVYHAVRHSVPAGPSASQAAEVPWPQAATLKLENGRVDIPLPLLSDGQAHFFECELGIGQRARVFAVQSSTGIYHASLDGCGRCENNHYYPRGKFLVCSVCGNEFSIDQFGQANDECAPIALHRSVDRESLVLDLIDINKAVAKLHR
ncbi:MAG: Fe-S-containing protein, partial [Bacillota bacterium]